MEIWHRFIRELVEDGTLTLEFIHTDDQKANLFTKALDSKRFEFLRQNIGVISMEWSLFFLLISHAFASSLYAFFVLFKNKKLKKSEKYKNSVCLYMLVLVYLWWPLKQSF